MAYDETLAERVRHVLRGRAGIAEKRMFGGLAFLQDGHMFVGISGHSLMARVGPEHYETALAREHVRVMDFTGKPMRGYVYVDPDGLANPADLRAWVLACADFVATLPAKSDR